MTSCALRPARRARKPPIDLDAVLRVSGQAGSPRSGSNPVLLVPFGDRVRLGGRSVKSESSRCAGEVSDKLTKRDGYSKRQSLFSEAGD